VLGEDCEVLDGRAMVLAGLVHLARRIGFLEETSR
jgi:hypothetical protein